MLFTVMTRMMAVIIMGCASVVIGKSKSDRHRSNYPAFVTAMCTMITMMDHASLENETHHKYEQHGNPCGMLTHRKIPGVGRTVTGTHDCYSFKMADLFRQATYNTKLLIW